MSPPDSNPDARPADDARRIETLLGNLLRIGVGLSVLCLVGGMLVSLIRHPDYATDTETLGQLTTPGTSFPHTIRDLGVELGQFRGRAIMTVGLLVLIATPVLRVTVSIFGFAGRRDWTYVVLTTLVLLILLVSSFVGWAV